MEELAKDADCSDPIESRKSGQPERTYKSRMTISHALLLAAVKDAKERKKLLDEAIANYWTHKALKEKSRKHREGAFVRKAKPGTTRVRSRQTINTITKVTAELLKLLKELEAPAFALAITKSDRRERKDTLKKLTKLVSTFEVIREKLPAAEEAAKAAAKELKTFIDQKR